MALESGQALRPPWPRFPVLRIRGQQLCRSAGWKRKCPWTSRRGLPSRAGRPRRHSHALVLTPSHPLPPSPRRHPGGAAEAHPDDLAVCGACAERSLRPLPALGVLPSAYASTATGVFCDNPAPGPEPGGATRPLGPGPTPRTPAQTEVPLSPPLLALLLPCTPTRHPRLSLESPLHPERTGGPRRPSRAQRSCQHPARPDLRTLRARPDRQRAASAQRGRSAVTPSSSRRTVYLRNAVPTNFASEWVPASVLPRLPLGSSG